MRLFRKYILVALLSVVPLIELRGAIPIAMGWGLDFWVSLGVCVAANILPVPVIYFFARKVLEWGRDRKHIGKFCTFCLVKGEKAGQKLQAKTGRGGLFVALMLFVGIPIPGTGAWTGTLAASLLNMGPRSATASVSLGVLIAGIIMSITSAGVFYVIGG